MARPKKTYRVLTERIVKIPVVVEARDEGDAIRQIKKATKSGTDLADIASEVGAVEVYGRLIVPAKWEVTELGSSAE